MSGATWILSAAALASLAIGQPFAFGSERAAALAGYADGEISLAAAPSPSGPPVLTLTKAGAAPVTVTLPDEVFAVESLRRLTNGLALAVGQISGDGQEAVLLNLHDAQVHDRFYGYNISASPNGRYVAFERFFPNHFMTAEQASNVLTLYNVLHSPRANRGAATDVHELVDVGTRLYPPVGADTEVHAFKIDRVFWSADSSKLVVLDQQQPKDLTPVMIPGQNVRLPPRPTLTLVLAQPSAGGVAPAVGTTPIGPCPGRMKSPCYMRLTGATFGTYSVTAELSGYMTMAGERQSISVNYDKFEPVK